MVLRQQTQSETNDAERDADKHAAEGADGTATEDGAGDEHARAACGQQERGQDVCAVRAVKGEQVAAAQCHCRPARRHQRC